MRKEESSTEWPLQKLTFHQPRSTQLAVYYCLSAAQESRSTKLGGSTIFLGSETPV